MSNILVADDDGVMVRLLELNLKKAGHSVIICRDGLAVNARVAEQVPDLAIIDYLLPGKSGLDLIREFKADPALSHIPLVVVTGQGKESTRDALLEAGASYVFTKPFSPTALLARITELLEAS